MFELSSKMNDERSEEIGDNHVGTSAKTPLRADAFDISDEEKIEKIQETYNKAFEARELSTVQTGGAFAQIKSFEVLGDAAQNQGDGTVGALLGAGIGLGAGLPLGSQMANQMDLGSKSNDRTTTEKLAELKQMFDQGLISEEQYQNKQNALLEDL